MQKNGLSEAKVSRETADTIIRNSKKQCFFGRRRWEQKSRKMLIFEEKKGKDARSTHIMEEYHGTHDQHKPVCAERTA